MFQTNAVRHNSWCEKSTAGQEKTCPTKPSVDTVDAEAPPRTTLSKWFLGFSG